MSERLKKCIMHFLAIFIIFYLCCFNLSKLRYIGVLNDEFGYWANAAALVGYDWHELIAETPYFAIGYSIWLVPIVKFLSSAELWYKAAIILNIFFLVAAYFLCCATGEKLFPNSNKEIIYLASLVVIIYPGNIAYSQIAWSETLQYLLVWCITYFIVRLEKRFTYSNLAIVLLLIIYSLCVHLRNISLIVVGVICLLMLLIKNKKPWYVFLSCFLILAVGYAFINWIKNYQILSYWNNSTASKVNNVTFNGNMLMWYMNSLFHNFRIFLSSLGNKLFYLILGTGFLFVIAGGSFIMSIINKQYLFRDEVISKFWCFSIAVIAWGLCSLQAMNWQERKDLTVYSRYMEQAMGPIVFVGIMEFLTNLKKVRKYIMIAGIFFLSIFSNVYQMIGNAQMQFNTVCSPVIGAYIDNTDNLGMAFQWILFVIGLLMVLLIGFTYMKRECLCQIMILLTFGILFAVTGIKGVSATADNREDFVSKNMIPLKEKIDDCMNQDLLYVKNIQNDQYSVNPKFVQFMYPQKTIHIVELDDLNKINETALVFVNPNDTDSISFVESMEGTNNIANTMILKLYQIRKD